MKPEDWLEAEQTVPASCEAAQPAANSSLATEAVLEKYETGCLEMLTRLMEANVVVVTVVLVSVVVVQVDKEVELQVREEVIPVGQERGKAEERLHLGKYQMIKQIIRNRELEKIEEDIQDRVQQRVKQEQMREKVEPEKKVGEEISRQERLEEVERLKNFRREKVKQEQIEKAERIKQEKERGRPREKKENEKARKSKTRVCV